MVLMSGASNGECHCPQTEARSWPRVGGVRQHVMLGLLVVPKAAHTLKKEESIGQSKGPPEVSARSCRKWSFILSPLSWFS